MRWLLLLMMIAGCGRDELRRFYPTRQPPVVPGTPVMDAGPSVECPQELAQRGVFSPPIVTAGLRFGHTATLLEDGRVLLAGGEAELRTSEYFDPTTDSFMMAGPMTESRRLHAAIRLDDGRVLVAGGLSSDDLPLATAEIYDPATDTWTPTGSLEVPRYYLTLNRLPDGRIVAVGGWNMRVTRAVEVFDGAGWQRITSMNDRRGYHATTTTDDGLLVTGGFQETRTAEVYRAEVDEWEVVDMPGSHELHPAVQLLDGRTMVIGGNSAEVSLFNDGFSRGEQMLASRSTHTATLLCSGEVLVVGGSPVLPAELFDGSRWRATPMPNFVRSGHTATALNDGRVLVTGGSDGQDVIRAGEVYGLSEP